MLLRKEPIPGISEKLEIWLDRYRRELLLVLLLVGAVLRFLVLAKSHFVLDGDEAVTGLMTRHFYLQGELAPFFYGQSYMAPTDAWLAAPGMAIFGGSGWVKAGPFLWSALLVFLNWWLARLFFGNKMAAWAAALLTVLPPLYFMINSLRALGSFTITLVLGDLLLLLTCQLVFRSENFSKRRIALLWAGLGLVAGFSFYAFWLVAFYYGPVFFYLFLKDKLFFARKNFAIFAAAFVLGSAPFWIYNLFNNAITFRYFFEAKPGSVKPPAGDVLSFFFNTGLPLVAGSQNYWLATPRAIGLVLSITWLVIWFGWVVARWKGLAGWFYLSLRPGKPVDMLLLFGLISPILYLVSGVGNNALALPGVDTTGRYLLPLMGVAPVLAGGALGSLANLPYALGRFRFGLPTASLALLMLLGCQFWPYLKIDYVQAFQSTYFTAVRPPLDNRAAIEYLKSQGVEYATCNHWVGNRLMLDAEEAVKCVDYYDIKVWNGPERFPALTKALVEPGRRVGFVLVNPGAGPTPLEEKLQELSVSFSRRDFAPYTIIIPTSRAVSPDEVIEALRYPY